MSGHVTIGGPFTTGHVYKTGRQDFDHMVAWHYGCILYSGNLGQRPQSYKNTLYVIIGNIGYCVPVKMVDDKIDLLLQWERLFRNLIHRSVCCTKDHLAFPRDKEQDPSIVSFWEHHSSVASEKMFVNNQMDTL